MSYTKPIVALATFALVYVSCTAFSGSPADMRAGKAVADAIEGKPVAPAAPACDPARFTVLSKSGLEDDGFFVITGKVRNDNPMPCGVKVQAVFYNAAKAQVGTDASWVARTRNIAPGATHSFTMRPLRDSTQGARSFTVEGIDATVWK